MARSSEYRKKMKEKNPDKYREYLDKQKERAKLARDKLKRQIEENVGPAQKRRDQIREQNRMRSRKFRERHSGENGGNIKRSNKLVVKLPIVSVLSPTSGTTGTRYAVSNRRKQWRDYKREYRNRLGVQKKRRIREKDMKRKKERREKARKQKLNTFENGTFSSKKAFANAASKVKQALPKDPEKFACVIDSVIEKASPRKRKALNKKDLTPAKVRCTLTSRLSQTFKVLPTAVKKAAAKVLSKYNDISQRKMSTELKLNRKTIYRAEKQGVRRKQRKTKVDKSKVLSFYKREDISRQLPGKRYATKEGPGFVIQMSLKAAFAIFKKEHPLEKIGFTKFTLLRPRNVRLISMSHRDFCLCTYCLNIKYKLLALNRVVTQNVKLADENALVDMLMCEKSDGARFHQPECVLGTCIECSDLRTTIYKFYENVDSTTVVSWNHWERKVTDDGRNKRILVAKRESMEVILEELVADVCHPTQGTTFISHIFVAHWQYKQYSLLKENLPQGWLLMVIDFAKNKSVFYQDEIKEAFFGQNQITVHPIVMFYLNDKQKLVRDSLICISEDRIHDVHAVKHFMNLADNYLKENNVHVTKKVVFSDGCAAQYKSSKAFADLSLSKLTTDRNYFGSEHGKGESDGETGVLNRAVDRAIIGRRIVIQNARDMYDWCKANMETNEDLSKRHFSYISKTEIKRNRPYVEVSTLKGSRKIHQAQMTPAKPYCLTVRCLSCFCKFCRLGTTSKCVNSSYVGQFSQRKLTLKPSVVSVVSDEDQGLDLEELFPDISHVELEVDSDLDLDELDDTDVHRRHISEIPLSTTNTNQTNTDVHEKTTNECDSKLTSNTIGNFIKARYGSSIYPVVVVCTPEGFDEPPPSTIYGKYFEAAPTSSESCDLWRLDDKTFLIMADEVLGSLPAPNIVTRGTRLLYQFSL